MEETQSSGTTAEEIDLLELAKKIWARRIFVLKAAGIGALVAVGLWAAWYILAIVGGIGLAILS